jgi:predicted nucleic acid-binding protein
MSIYSPRYKIILDSKVLKLYLIGSIDKNLIRRLCKDFVEEDFNELIAYIIYECEKIIVTPHILTEVSNFIRKATGKDYFKGIMEKTLDHIEYMKIKEISISKKELVKSDKKCLCAFGFTDAAIFNVLRKSSKYMKLVTTDDDFLAYCTNNKINGLKFPIT